MNFLIQFHRHDLGKYREVRQVVFYNAVNNMPVDGILFTALLRKPTVFLGHAPTP